MPTENGTKIQEFVKAHQGHTPISRILIANNGMAAVKCIRSIRRWAYEELGDEKLIHFIAIATPDDLKVNAEYIKMADSFVEVRGGAACNNYANVDLIVDLAARTGCHVCRESYWETQL